MSYNNVDKSTGNLIPVAGATLYADLPVGSWVKNDMGTIPYGFLKEGDTISQSEYPDLYTKYGSTVPYMADTSELSEYESITLPTTSGTAITMQYDGFLNISQVYNSSMNVVVYINGVNVSRAGGNNLTLSQSFIFKKGDVIYAEKLGGGIIEKVAYYKKSLILKAKSTGAPTDIIEGVKDALGSYSTTETVVGTWIDGKPIYKQVISVGTPQLGSGSWVELVTYSFAVDTFVSCTLVNKTSNSTTGTQLYNNFQIRQGSSKKVEFLFEQNITAATSRYVILEYTKV